MNRATISFTIVFSVLLVGCTDDHTSPPAESLAGNEISVKTDLNSTTTPDVEIMQTEGELKYIREPDVMFVPTPQEVVDRMLELAQVTKDDLVYDLGCGDGRIVVTAAKTYGCKAIGYDINPERVKESRENVEMNNVGDLVTIEQADIFTLDLSNATVITLYLLPDLNVKLIPQLEKLKPGSRIVSHAFDMQGVIPDKVETVNGRTIYFWTTPLKKEEIGPAH
jgi:tRNA G37 N-methylase Trm5